MKKFKLNHKYTGKTELGLHTLINIQKRTKDGVIDSHEVEHKIVIINDCETITIDTQYGDVIVCADFPIA